MSKKDSTLPDGLIPPNTWNDHFDWPPPGGMRHIIFYADTNGFAPAITRVGRSVLIDPVEFWRIAKAFRQLNP